MKYLLTTHLHKPWHDIFIYDDRLDNNNDYDLINKLIPSDWNMGFVAHPDSSINGHMIQLSGGSLSRSHSSSK